MPRSCKQKRLWSSEMRSSCLTLFDLQIYIFESQRFLYSRTRIPKSLTTNHSTDFSLYWYRYRWLTLLCPCLCATPQVYFRYFSYFVPAINRNFIHARAYAMKSMNARVFILSLKVPKRGQPPKCPLYPALWREILPIVSCVTFFCCN